MVVWGLGPLRVLVNVTALQTVPVILMSLPSMHLDDSTAELIPIVAQSLNQLLAAQQSTNIRIDSLQAQIDEQIHELCAFRQQLKELHQVEPRENLPAAINQQINQLRSTNSSLSKAQLEMQKQFDSSSPQANHPTSESSQRDAQTDADLLEPLEVEELQESIWTSVFFLGTPLLGLGGSALSFVVLFLNLCIQLLFCGIVYERFTQNPFVQQNVDAFRLWRQTIAHDYRNMDPISGASLASRVCTETMYRNSLDISTRQAQAVELIRDYLPHDRANAMQQIMCGPTMCVIALICWFSSIANEMWDLRLLSMSTYFLPKGDSTHIESVDGSLVLRNLSCPRKIFILLMVCIRLYILVILCIAGTQYVVYTVSVQELLLNCVALAFVLDVDNLLMAFAPRQLQAIIRAMMPLKSERPCIWQGADATSVAFLVMLLVSVVTVSCTMLWSFYDNIAQAEEQLCHGELNFVYTVGASGQIFWVSTNDLDSFGFESSFQTQSVQEILGRNVSDDTKLAWRLSSLGQLRTYSNQLVQDAFASCDSDRLESFDVNQLVIQQSVRDFLQFEVKSREFLQAGSLTIQDVLNMDRCQPFSWLCTLKGDLGLRMRMFCPVTCGCNDVRKYVTDRGLSQGCDDSCDAGLLMRARLGNATCNDLGKAELNIQNFMKEFDDYRRRSRGLPEGLLEDLRIFHFGDMLHEYGCGAIAQYNQEYGGETMCRHRSFFWFLHMYCPVSCGCRDSTTILSPQAACPAECSLIFITSSVSENIVTRLINATVSRLNAREPGSIGRVSANAGDMDSSMSTTLIGVSALTVTSTTYVTTRTSNAKKLEAAVSAASAAADVTSNMSTPFDANFTSSSRSAESMIYFASSTTTTSAASQ